MITESITPTAGTCSHCQRADVPCLELGCSERDEGRRSVYAIRLELRVVVCVACLDAARVKRDVRRTRFDAPKLPAPSVPATCGVCDAFTEVKGGHGLHYCSLSEAFGGSLVSAGEIPGSACPLRKGAA